MQEIINEFHMIILPKTINDIKKSNVFLARENQELLMEFGEHARLEKIHRAQISELVNEVADLKQALYVSCSEAVCKHVIEDESLLIEKSCVSVPKALPVKKREFNWAFWRKL